MKNNDDNLKKEFSELLYNVSNHLISDTVQPTIEKYLTNANKEIKTACDDIKKTSSAFNNFKPEIESIIMDAKKERNDLLANVQEKINSLNQLIIKLNTITNSSELVEKINSLNEVSESNKEVNHEMTSFIKSFKDDLYKRIDKNSISLFDMINDTKKEMIKLIDTNQGINIGNLNNVHIDIADRIKKTQNENESLLNKLDNKIQNEIKMMNQSILSELQIINNFNYSHKIQIDIQNKRMLIYTSIIIFISLGINLLTFFLSKN